MDKGSINVFEVKLVRKDIGYKISAADVFNQFLYLGDEKGNIHAYPIRVGESDIISKTQNQNSKNISKYKIDKILCYKEISTILVLTGETLIAVDSAFRRPQALASKISDFAINQTFDGQGVYSVVAISKKKEGYIFVYDPTQKKLVDVKNKFSVSDVPTNVAYSGKFIVISTKKDYESLNMDKDFALKKGPLQAKFPFVRVVGPSQILCMSDDIGLLMNPQFEPKPKDNVVVSRPVQQISIAGNYCFVLCDTILQIYLNYDKKFSLVQQLPINIAKGVTNSRPFIYNREDLYFLYEIPYETQIKGLLDKCRVDDAISLLIQKVGPENEQKIQQLKIEAIWPLLKKMQFQKAKQLAKATTFDVRQLILLYSQLLSLQMDSMKGAKAQKTMATLIIQYVNQKAQKSKDEQIDLKRKSKLFIKEVLQQKREFYLSQGVSGKIKKSFPRAKNSLIKGPLASVTSEELLEIIDFTLIKWYFEMGMLRQLEDFLLANPSLYCQKYFSEFEDNIRKNPKLFQVPTLKPRLFAAFQKNDEAYQSWQKVAESSQKEEVIKIACEQAVNLLTKLEDKTGIQDKLDWILKIRPETAMRLFELTPVNFLQSDKIIKKFQREKNDRYLELFLETIVINKNTEIEAYHTKLMLLYLDNLFKLHPKQSKQQSKNKQFQQRLKKFRTLQKNPNARFASQPILRKIDKCQWLLEDQIFLYSREKRHEDALRRYISKNMSEAAVKYCEQNGDQTLTIYFKMLLTMYRSYESSKNNAALLLKRDIIIFLAQHASSPELDPLVVLEQIPDDWMLNQSQGAGGVYQFLQSAITHTLHEKRSTYTAKHLSEMDLLNVEYNFVQAKRAYLRFTLKKTCCICNACIGDRTFVVYPNANVCHQACMKKDKNALTVCPVTKQDFQKTFKY